MHNVERIQCPFCEGGAIVKQNNRGDPFISCPTCGPMNLKGPKYRGYIEAHKRSEEPSGMTGQESQVVENKREKPDLAPEKLYNHTASDDPWMF